MKRKIIIHNPKSYRYRKYYNVFFDHLIKKLHTKFDVIENRDWPYAHEKPFPVKLMCNDASTAGLLECEMILENFDTKKLKILSVCDLYTDVNLRLFNSDQYKDYIETVLISQFNRKSIEHHTYGMNGTIYKPWIYFPSGVYNFDKLYRQRQKKKNLIDKFYFRGSGVNPGEHRPLVSLFDQKLFYGGGSIGNFDTYSEEAINYAVGFSCAGTAQFCYRDIEYMAMGILMLRFRYINEMEPQLIPNKHYISTDEIFDTHEEHHLNDKHARMIENKFLQIKNNYDFLEYISKNARSYYLNYIHKNIGIQHTIDILNLDQWY